MTTEQLVRIEALCKAATPGPWERREGAYLDSILEPSAPDSEIAEVMGADNAAFIAASRTAVPALCQEVRRLREENERLNMTAEITPEERAEWRIYAEGTITGKKVIRLLDALEAVEAERDALLDWLQDFCPPMTINQRMACSEDCPDTLEATRNCWLAWARARVETKP